MPLSAGRDLNSSIEAYGQRRMFWHLTFISNTMLPTDGTIETTVCVFASCSCTTSPFCRAEYGCADAVIANASVQVRAAAVLILVWRMAEDPEQTKNTDKCGRQSTQRSRS